MTTAPFTGCDAGLARRGRAQAAGPRPRLALAASITASALAFVDGSVVNVGLPAIGRELGGSGADLAWLVNAYLLPLSALILLGGALGDRFGRGRLLVLGVVVFAVGSAACAVAPGLAALLAARALQGAGAALAMPNSLALLGEAYDGPARGKAVGAWAAITAAAAAVGPVLGGWLIDQVGWRAIFLINLPLAAAAIALTVAAAAPRPAAPEGRPDVLGSVLATAALGLVAYGLTEGSGPSGWSAAAWAACAAGVVAGAAFVMVEARLGDRALVPASLFANRAFAGLNLMTLLVYGAFGGFIVLLPDLLISSAGYRATAAGAALLPFPLVMALGAPIMGRVVGRAGPAPLLTAGPLIAGAGFLLMTRIGPGGDYLTEVLPCVLVSALGMACTAAPLTTAVLSEVDGRHTGAASGINSAVARAGGLMATALLGAILAEHGPALISAARPAAVAGAALAAAGAGFAAWGLRLGRRPQA